MTKTYSTRSNARAAARSASMDLTGLALAQLADGRWAWMPAAEAVVAQPAAETAPVADPIADEIAAGTDIADAEEEEFEPGDRETFVPHSSEVVQQTTADLAAELRADLAADVAAVAQAEGIEVRQFGTLDAMVDSVFGDLAAQSREVDADMAKRAGDATAALHADDATLDEAITYTVSFKIERKTLALATTAAGEFAKKLGFSVLVIGPTGEAFAATPGMKAGKAGKVAAAKGATKATAKPSTGEPSAKQAALIAQATKPTGATAKELADAVGWPSIAARTTLTKIGDRFGYRLVVTPKTGSAQGRFKLVPATA